MIFKWIDHEAFNREEQLMHLIYDLGMATNEQLLTVSGWHPRNLEDIIRRLRKREAEEENEWLITHYLPATFKRRRKGVYTLGKSALKHVHQMRQLDKRITASPSGQMSHFVGINNILCRAIEQFGKNNISWIPTHEATDLILLRLSEKNIKEFNKRTIIRPDAKLVVNKQPYYIEFDNNTENPRQLESKYTNYINILIETQDTTPVLWVTINEKRRDYLKKNWEALLSLSYSSDMRIPTFYFALQGEENEYFKNSLEHIEDENKLSVPGLKRNKTIM